MHTNRPFTRSVVLLAAFFAMAAVSARAADGPDTSPEKEKELLAVLRSDAPSAEKAITCKLLAIHGSSAAVPDLARLLHDEQLASWARIALEVIPGAAADEALRTATESLQGRLLVGTINSIGVRRDANAVDPLTAHLQDENAEVASAAAVALGRIGNVAATRSLRQALTVAPVKVRSAVAEGCVLCAERLLGEGKSVEATQIYDEVRQADVPKQRIIEATRGAILARNQEGIPLLLELFRSPDKGMFQLALGTAREFPGSEVDKALAAEMVRATPDRAALIIQAMADRTETVVLLAVLEAAGQGPKQVRLAAIRALGRVGDASCLSALLEIGLDADADLAQTTRATLADLPGEEVDAQIVALLPTAEGRVYALLIELVGNRRIDAIPALLEALDHADGAVRSAALTALGETVALDGLSVLISQAVDPRYSEDEPVAQQALKAASIRMPDREACAAELAAAIERTSSVPTKSSLLKILGAVGGTKALATIGAAANSTELQLQDISSRLLGEWMTADAAPELLALAKNSNNKFKIRTLRGYIRIARQLQLPEEQRLAMCRKAMQVAERHAEKELILDVLDRNPSVESLNQVVSHLENPTLREKAGAVAVSIAEKIVQDHPAQVADAMQHVLQATANNDLAEKTKVLLIEAKKGVGNR